MAASPPPEPGPADPPPAPPAIAASAAAWLSGIPADPPASELGALQLAWLGDAVWELHQRRLRCRVPARSASLHGAVVEAVRAEAQARALQRLEPLLRPAEREQVRRGRNRAGRGPRRGEAAAYGQATGFETMLGWLFLQNPKRLAELLDHLETSDSPSPSASP